MRRRLHVRGVLVGTAMLLSGVGAVLHGLAHVKAHDVALAGPVRMHVDDADTLTLDAQPWVSLEDAWLFGAMATPVCAQPGCDVVVPVGSRQLWGDCTARAPAAGPQCGNIRLGLVMTAPQWSARQGAAAQPGFPSAVEGLVVDGETARPAWAALETQQRLPPAPRVLLRLGASPPAPQGSRWYVLWGAVAVLLGGMVVVWALRATPVRHR